MKKYTFKNTFSLRENILPIIGWMLLVLVTFGLAWPFMIIYYLRELIRHTQVHEGM